MAGRLGGHMRWTARYSIRYKKGGGMVTASPYVCILVNIRGQVWFTPDMPGFISPTAWMCMVILQWSRYMRGECLLEAGW